MYITFHFLIKLPGSVSLASHAPKAELAFCLVWTRIHTVAHNMVEKYLLIRLPYFQSTFNWYTRSQAPPKKCNITATFPFSRFLSLKSVASPLLSSPRGIPNIPTTTHNKKQHDLDEKPAPASPGARILVLL